MGLDEPYLLKAGANHIGDPATGFEKVLAWNPLALLTGQFGRIARGGFLYVTPTHVLFRPHQFNDAVEASQLRIPLAEITGFRTKQKGLSAMLVLSTARGIDVEFLSWSRQRIIDAITAAKQQPPQGHNQPM